MSVNRLIDIVGQALGATRPRAPMPVPFIESKSFDIGQVSRLLELSRDAEQWANFGPVSQLLERCIADYLQLAPDRRVIMCSSGTAALFAMAAAEEVAAGRRLRWAVSSYGFHCTHMGPFACAAVLDCDQHGLLDLEALRTLNPTTCDGVLLTNTFGLHSDLSRHLTVCQEKNLRIIIDNATVLDGFNRTLDGGVDEFVSFHQTKPWGMGEGGCAIVSTRSADAVRAMTNFGVGLPAFPRALATNAKISEAACAAILSRLMTAPQWRPLYRAQAQRIAAIATDCGYSLLSMADFNATVAAHVPLVAPIAVPIVALDNPWCVLQKYYRPLAPTKNATFLYERIVNVPSHPGMSVLTDAEIELMLSTIMAKARDHQSSTTISNFSSEQELESHPTPSSTISG